MIDKSESSLVLRVRESSSSGASNGNAAIEIEALLDYETIFPASPAKLDLNQLKAAWGDSGNAYGRLLGNLLYSSTSVQNALHELGDPETVRVQLMLEGSGGLLETIRWERMEVPQLNGGPLSVNPATPFSRFAAVGRRPDAAPEDQVFRLLLAVASPVADGLYQIDPEDECASVVEACGPLLDRNQLRIAIMPGAKKLGESGVKRLTRTGVTFIDGASTADRIAGELLADSDAPHGLHLIAHGTYQPAQREFFLLLESDTGGLRALKGQALVRLWQPQRLRLIVLESCQSGVTGDPTPPDLSAFKERVPGFMQLLVDAGVPGVVAMQDSIAVADARTFNLGFYSRLLETGLADEAVNNGRQLLRERPGDAWSIPAFTTRLKRGAIWVESPIRRAGRLLYTKLQQARQDRFFPDFPIAVVPLLTHDIKARSKSPSQTGIDDLPVTGVQVDVHCALGRSLANPATENHLICLLGDSGGSKTTILEATFLREIERHWKGEQPAIPVMLRLQDCIYSKLNATTTIADAISKYFHDRTGFTPNTSYIASRFRERSFLFLIGGDDDFTQGSLQDALKIFKAFREASASRRDGDQHRYVLTLDRNSLTLADLPDDSECLILQPMSVERVGRYLISPALNQTEDKTETGIGEQLRASLRENGLFDLAEVPWLLSEMLDQQRRGVGEQSRSAILQRITDERICQVSGSIGIRARVEQAIFRIAWEIQARRERSLPGGDLFRILSELRGNRDFSLFEFRKRLIEDCKLLAPTGEDGVRFAYPGFLAYCCAQYIRSQPDEDRERILEDITATLGRRSRVNLWTETLIVLAGLQRDAGKVMLLLRMILSGSPLNEGEQVFVAARCLQEARLAFASRPNPDSQQSQADNAMLKDDPIVRSIVSSIIYHSHPRSYGSVGARKRALEYLGPLKEECAVAHLVSLVLDKLRPGKECAMEFDYSGVRLAAIKALLYTREAAMKAINSDPQRAGNQGLQLVIDHWLKLDGEELAKDLLSTDPTVSSISAFALGLMKPEGALTKLSARFEAKDANSDLLWALADSMLELGDPNLVKEVARYVKVESRWPYAAYLIGKLGAPRREPSFIEFLREHIVSGKPGDEGLRGRCLQALAELGESGVREVCSDWLSQPNQTLRYYALQGLRHAGDMTSLATLERLQWNQENTPLFERLRLEVYDDLYWRLAGGLSREVMAPM